MEGVASIPQVMTSQSSAQTNGRTSRILVCILLLLAALIYLRTLGFGFLGYDDPHQVYDNYIVTGGLNLETVKRSFTSFVIAHYQPLVTISFAVEYALVGSSPFLYHLDNLILHLLNVILLYVLALRITKNRAGALFVAAAFALHPMKVESVAWITGRKDVLGGFFYLSSFLAYVHYREEGGGGFLAWSIVLFMCSLLCKAVAVTLMPVLLAYELILVDGSPGLAGKLAIRLLPFVVLAAVSSVMVVMAHGWAGGFGQFSEMGLPYRLLLASRNILYYPLMLLFPLGLHIYHPLPEGPAGSLPFLYQSAPLLLLVILASLYLFGRRNRLLRFGAVFYLVAILPVSQIVPFGRVVAADRFSYLPSIGLLLMLWALVGALLRRFRRARIPVMVTAVIWLLLLAHGTYSRVGVWRREPELWSEVIERYPNESYPYTLRGFAYHQAGETGLALHDYRTAISLGPEDPRAYEWASFILTGEGKYRAAAELLRSALTAHPDTPELITAMGYMHLESGDKRRAREWFARSLAVDSTGETALYGMAVLLAGDGDVGDAERMLRRSLRYDPDFPQAHNLLGNILLDRGMVDSALTHLGKAARFERGDLRSEYLIDMGRALLGGDDVEGAIDAFSRALELDEGSYVAHYNLGNALMRAGRASDAVQSYDAAIALNPDLPQPYLNRGNAFLGQGMVGYALEDYTSAIEADSSYAMAWANRARVLHQLGRHEGALNDMRKAVELGYRVDPRLMGEIERAADVPESYDETP